MGGTRKVGVWVAPSTRGRVNISPLRVSRSRLYGSDEAWRRHNYGEADKVVSMGVARQASKAGGCTRCRGRGGRLTGGLVGRPGWDKTATTKAIPFQFPVTTRRVHELNYVVFLATVKVIDARALTIGPLADVGMFLATLS